MSLFESERFRGFPKETPLNIRSKRRAAALAAAGVAAATAVTAVSMSATAQEQATPEGIAVACEIETLPLPDEAVLGYAEAISSSGSFVAGLYTAPVDDDPDDVDLYTGLWQDGELDVLEFPDGETRVMAVNDSGVVASYVVVPELDTLPYVHRDGEAVQVPGVDLGSAFDVNNAGDVVGERTDTSLRSEPYLWRADAEEAETLPLPDGSHGGSALGVDDAGTVVGWYQAADREILPYAWDADGEGRELPADGDVDTTASKVAGSWVIGLEDDEDSVRWNLDDDEAPELLDFDAAAVNSQGWVAGRDGTTAVLLADDERVELPSFGTNPRAARAYGISDDGSVLAGRADDPDRNENVPVLWRCG